MNYKFHFDIARRSNLFDDWRRNYIQRLIRTWRNIGRDYQVTHEPEYITRIVRKLNRKAALLRLYDRFVPWGIALCFVGLVGFFHWMDLQASRRVIHDAGPVYYTHRGSSSVYYISPGPGQDVLHQTRPAGMYYMHRSVNVIHTGSGVYYTPPAGPDVLHPAGDPS